MYTGFCKYHLYVYNDDYVCFLATIICNSVVISLPDSTVREKMTEKGTGKDHKNSVNSSRVHGGSPVCNWSVWRKGFVESKSEKVVVYVENVAVKNEARLHIMLHDDGVFTHLHVKCHEAIFCHFAECQ